MNFKLRRDKEDPKFDFEPKRTVEEETIQRWRALSGEGEGAPAEKDAKSSGPAPLFRQVQQLDDEEESVKVRPAWANDFGAKTEVFENVSAPKPLSIVRPQQQPQPAFKIPPPQPSVEDDFRSRFGGEVRSALGPGTVIEGKFSFDSPVQIDGTLKGEVIATSALIVGEGALVEASVKVGSLVVIGEVVGAVEAEDLIEIRRSGSLEGNIQCARLIVEEGGIFRGKCNI